MEFGWWIEGRVEGRSGDKIKHTCQLNLSRWLWGVIGLNLPFPSQSRQFCLIPLVCPTGCLSGSCLPPWIQGQRWRGNWGPSPTAWGDTSWGRASSASMNIPPTSSPKWYAPELVPSFGPQYLAACKIVLYSLLVGDYEYQQQNIHSCGRVTKKKIIISRP